VVKKAWNPDTGQEYEIELPADNLVIEALLKLDYPPDGIDKWEIAEMLAEQFSLTDEQRDAKYKNGRRVFNVHLGLVSADLVKLGKMVKPGGYRWGRKLNESSSDASDGSYGSESKSKNDLAIPTPEKSIEENYQDIRRELAAELLQKIKDNTPAFFEELVIDLLVKMGYGGSREDAGKAVGKSGDGGIDGIINEDRLGLDMIYVQAKRWTGNVGEPPVRDFVGALDGEGVQKGIFITTSDFHPAAKRFAERSSKRIILINGHQLAQLMIEHDVGVSTVETHEIKRVDSDYFIEDAG
jgi:restriction system protein